MTELAQWGLGGRADDEDRVSRRTYMTKTQFRVPISAAAVQHLTLPVPLQFMHSCAYLLADYHSEDATSGWEYCMIRKKSEAAGCAESMGGRFQIPTQSLTALCVVESRTSNLPPRHHSSACGRALVDLRPLGTTTGGYTMSRVWDNIPGGNNDADTLSDDEAERRGRRRRDGEAGADRKMQRHHFVRKQ